MNRNKHLWMTILWMISLSTAWSQDYTVNVESSSTPSDSFLFRSPVLSGAPGSGLYLRNPPLISPSLYNTPPDTIPPRVDWKYAASVNKPFPFKSFIIPGVMIAYGFTALNSHGLKSVNLKVREEIWTEDPHPRTHIDNILQFSPAISVYALNLAGIHGKHNFKDRTMIYLMANLFAEGTVFSLKGMTHQLRPDGSAYNSFPSGHTAEAFASAEFMRMEYKDVSPWYGVAGYAMATTTGMLRLYNNKHWLSDVVTGAGIGIASTRLAYWLYPIMQHAFGKSGSVNSVLMPSYQNGSFGLAYAHRF